MIKISSQAFGSIQLPLESLAGADLSGMNLHRAELSESVLCGARFVQSDLRAVLLDGADLRGCDFSGAKLMNAAMRRADLRQANLKDAGLMGAVLDDADLRGADLSGSDVGFASFIGANLCGAVLLCARLSEADLTDIAYDEETIFPDGFVAPVRRRGTGSRRSPGSGLESS